MNLGE